ncbi:CRISPR-associated helicase Cas3' [Paenactinomyces guangxiensis]|uniref:CRISPR-associated helicase Cas3 n=1 Tax=Paenactinomyces guangxiensis TaxID=1490290 RepID=A0A7W1WNP3_9BACL|nr:CRISPR-associated helicase Cas3' [Paenactinomyces guangxiensis]MBA4493253.1 CRISPR-associated helicase Cas3' [Paenactinomyces guangxiensis]MBH8589896.1 CRISPR-associated helicase Cas3' [Paenactinomyces guangxiensis]
MIKAKPYHGLLPHLEDASRVFQVVWEQNKEVYHRFCQRHGQDTDQIYKFLHLAVFLHDIGKANSVWQKYLLSDRGKTHVSHPLLSFSVLWELFTQWEGKSFLNIPLLRATLTSVLAHHHMLHENSYQHMRQHQPLQLSPEIVNNMIQTFLAKEPHKPFQPFTQNQLIWDGPTLAGRVKLLRQIVESLPKIELPREKALHTFFLSVICLCDNASSAVSEAKNEEGNLIEDEPSVNAEVIQELRSSWLPDCTLLDVRNRVFSSPNQLQQLIQKQIHPYMVLRAGCGEGKTGAALHFARYWLSQKQANRVIFTLPTRFTVNSMYADFKSPQGYNIPQDILGIYHSESGKVLSSVHDRQESVLDVRFHSIQDQTFRSNFYHDPVTISTVDHLLYSLLHSHKYADRAFGNLQQSVVIFDELHYYQSFTLEKIGECMRLLRQMQIPHLLMSATLPQSFLEKLNKMNRKSPYVCIESTGKTPDQSRVKMPFQIEKASEPIYDPETGISPSARSLIEEHLHVRQMIVVNQVERAKGIAGELQQLFPDHNIICYHSEFTPIDRQNKEKCIKALFKSKDNRTEQEHIDLKEFGYPDEDAVILVTTQICELSLDISCDLQLTELAPIDALSQRGGRLHRNGVGLSQEDCGCQICKQRNYLPDDFVYRQVIFPLDEENKNAGYPYVDNQDWIQHENNLLKRSWEIIGDKYTFPDVKEWVDQLYPAFESLSDDEMRRYIYEDAVFGKQPKDRFGKDYSADESEGTFQVRQSQYRTVDVIPAFYMQQILSKIQLPDREYLTAKDRKRIIDCIQDYTVPMKVYRFSNCHKNHLVTSETLAEGIVLLFVHVPYDPQGVGFRYKEEAEKNPFMI